MSHVAADTGEVALVAVADPVAMWRPGASIAPGETAPDAGIGRDAGFGAVDGAALATCGARRLCVDHVRVTACSAERSIGAAAATHAAIRSVHEPCILAHVARQTAGRSRRAATTALMPTARNDSLRDVIAVDAEHRRAAAHDADREQHDAPEAHGAHASVRLRT